MADILDPDAVLYADIITEISRQVSVDRERAALWFEGSSVSYGEMWSRTRRAAAFLRDVGVARGELVGIISYPGTEFIAALVGSLYAGAAPAVLDPQSPPLRLSAAIAGTGVRIILSDDVHHARALEISKGAGAPSGPAVKTITEALAAYPRQHLTPSEVAPRDPGYVVFTSGSTGQPKGVLQSRGTLNFIAGWQARRSGAATAARTVQRSALSFDVSLQEVLSTLFSGGCLYIVPGDVRHDFAYVAHFIEEHQITRTFTTPTGLQTMVESVGAGPLLTLREVICAGEPLLVSPDLRSAFGLISARLDNQYGPTETHVCTAAEVAGDPLDWADRPLIGHPLPGTSIAVVDHERMPVSEGTAGELVVSGPTVAMGYLGMDSPAFGYSGIPGFADDARWYRTGDWVVRAGAGGLAFVGREDHQLKIRAYRVELGEIEQAAISSGLAVRAVAFPIKEGDVYDRVGLVVPAQVDTAALVSALAQRLPAYMVPRPEEILIEDTFPVTASGKVDRARVLAGLKDRSATS